MLNLWRTKLTSFLRNAIFLQSQWFDIQLHFHLNGLYTWTMPLHCVCLMWTNIPIMGSRMKCCVKYCESQSNKIELNFGSGLDYDFKITRGKSVSLDSFNEISIVIQNVCSETDHVSLHWVTLSTTPKIAETRTCFISVAEQGLSQWDNPLRVLRILLLAETLLSRKWAYGSLARCAPEMPGMFFPPPQFSDPDMHHGTESSKHVCRSPTSSSKDLVEHWCSHSSVVMVDTAELRLHLSDMNVIQRI